MSAGQTFWFADYLTRVFDYQSADFGATPNTVKCILIKSTYTPTVGLADTRYEAGSPLYDNECDAGGSYDKGGKACDLPTSTQTSNIFKLDWQDPDPWTQNASNPANARWAVFYDATTLDCICFYDLGETRDMTLGELRVTMGVPALSATITEPA